MRRSDRRLPMSRPAVTRAARSSAHQPVAGRSGPPSHVPTTMNADEDARGGRAARTGSSPIVPSESAARQRHAVVQRRDPGERLERASGS